jgi:UDP:flavonoid glycosyltransferase YjiC (YdhE family)
MVKRALFIGEAVTLSHVARPVTLAQALHAAGYEVTLACDPRYGSLVESLPFRFIPIRSTIPADQVPERLTKPEPLFDEQTLDTYVKEDLRLLRAVRPDVVVGDMRQSLGVSAKVAKVPFINIIDAQFSPYCSMKFELVDYPGLDWLGRPMSEMVFQALLPFGSVAYSIPTNVIRMRYGIPGLLTDIREIYADGDYTVYPDVPEIVPTTNLPPNHSYVGPILWSASVPTPEWWDLVPDALPVVYVGLGSSGPPGLLPTVYEALAELPVSIIAATTPRGQAQPPANAYVANYLPGAAAARRARLVICNGGNMSGQQSLAEGTPFLGLVSNTDQFLFSKAVARTGAGEMLKASEATGAAIREIAMKMLAQPSYREAAQRIAGVYRQMNAAERFRGLVDRVCGVN